MSRGVLHYGDSSSENSHESTKRSNTPRKRRSKKSGCRSSNYTQGSANRSCGLTEQSLGDWRKSNFSELDTAGWRKVIADDTKDLFDTDSGVCLNQGDCNASSKKPSTKPLVDREISLDFDNSLLPAWSNFTTGNSNLFKKQFPKSCSEDARNVRDVETVPTRFPSNLFSLPACSAEFGSPDDSSIQWNDSKSQDCSRNNCESAKTNVVSSSVSSIDFNNRSLDTRLKNLSTSQSAKDISEMAKAFAQLTHLKQTNQIAVSNYLKDRNNQRVKSLNSEVPEKAKENASVETLKWNFPSSNRKREEKLRVGGRGVSNVPSDSLLTESPLRNSSPNVKFHSNIVPPSNIRERNDKQDLEQNLNVAYVPRVSKSKSFDEKNFKMTLTLESSDQSQVSIVSPSSSGTSNNFDNSANDSAQQCGRKSNHSSASNEILSASNSCPLLSDDKGGSGEGDEINTQSALIKISETLIESAQRAEMLLMQKMKEYNDLVCRDPPVKRVRDFDCQAQIDIVQAEPDFDNKISKIKDEYLGEINDKNIKIQRLEMEKKKLKQALKKTTLTVGKKVQGDNGCNNLDLEGGGDSFTLRSDTNLTTLEQPEKQKQRDELFQALKMENQLLHTLLKEMKLELDQENATIMSLAKKLETNMGIQNQIKTRQPDIVKELEDKLEMQERMLKQEAMEARAIAKYAIIKYKKLIQEYKERVKGHQYTVDKLTNAIK